VYVSHVMAQLVIMYTNILYISAMEHVREMITPLHSDIFCRILNYKFEVPVNSYLWFISKETTRIYGI
jgi:hypothetical protein